jgi:hypothetical protein
MYCTTKLAPELSNDARKFVSNLSNPGEEYLAEVGKCVGYLGQGKNLRIFYRKPDELRSVSTCGSIYAHDPNDRKSTPGRINTVGGTLSSWTSKNKELLRVVQWQNTIL